MRKFFFVLSLLFALSFDIFAQQTTVALHGEEGRKEAIEYDYFPHREYALYLIKAYQQGQEFH